MPRPRRPCEHCQKRLSGDEDAAVLEDALRARGVEAAAAVWNAPAVDWDAFDLVVLRSTWDYAEHYDEFLAWIDGLPRLANPAPVVRWSTDKRYLAELAAAGVPVTPTQYLEPGERLEPRSGRFVVKPVVSAGGRRAAAYAPERAADAAAHIGAEFMTEQDYQQQLAERNALQRTQTQNQQQ